MNRRAVLLGVVGGLVIGQALVLLRGLDRDHSVPLREDRGQITRVVMQYAPAAGPIVAPIYTQFLTALGKDIEVVWVVGRQADADDLRSRLGAAWPEGRCRVVAVGKEITTWSKDRFVALSPEGRPGPAFLCAPARSRTASDSRTNDQEVPYRLTRSLPRLFGVRSMDAAFDGGDILAAGGRVFAHPAILEKNPPGRGSPFRSESELKDYLGREMSTPITWLGSSPGDAPPHHIGMYLTVIGKSAFVGDVRLAESLGGPRPILDFWPVRGARRRSETQRALDPAGGEATDALKSDLQDRLDRTARQMGNLGFQVVRVPLLPSATPRAWMSYNNGILETRRGETVYYMPTFGAPGLDAAAARLFHRAAGCRVVPIDCSEAWPLGGSLHCLVNVVNRNL